MSISKYAFYDDRELIHLLNNNRLLSPIIDELCNRLEHIQGLEIEANEKLQTKYNDLVEHNEWMYMRLLNIISKSNGNSKCSACDAEGEKVFINFTREELESRHPDQS